MKVMEAKIESLAQGSIRRLTTVGNGDNRASFAIGGTEVFFATNRDGRSQIYSIGLDGRNLRRVISSCANDHGRVAPSPNGKHICFSSDRDGKNAIFVLKFASDAVLRVSDTEHWSFGPSWSVRDLIAYFSRQGSNVLNVWTVLPDGSQMRQITNHPGESRQPWWSPDGTRLAYSADNGSGRFRVHITAPDGSSDVELSSEGSLQQPVWSHDGKRLIVAADLDSGSRICLISEQGGRLQEIRQPEGPNMHPAWSPDGNHIVFTNGTRTESALYVFTFPS